MKKYICEGCGGIIELEDNQKPQYCKVDTLEECLYSDRPFHPLYCEKCMDKIYGKVGWCQY